MTFVEFYSVCRAQPSIQQVLAYFREEYALNENLLLFFLWVAVSPQKRLNKAEMQRALDCIAVWHESITNPLSKLHRLCYYQKRNSGSDDMPINISIRDISLSVVEIQQAATGIEINMLQEFYGQPAVKNRTDEQRLSDACHNLLAYFKMRQIVLNLCDKELLGSLLQNIFQHVAAVQIDSTLNRVQQNSHSEKPRYTQLQLEP